MEFPDQTCFGCGKMIREKEWKNHSQRVWHKKCFKCAKCHDQIEAPETLTFVQNNIYCTAHIENGEIGTNAVCPTCNVQFQPFDKNLLNANRYCYHEKCFKCQVCDKVLGEAKNEWVNHDNKVHCKPCYDKEVVNKCVKCKGPLGAVSTSTAAGLWCPKCFACHNCKRKLTKDSKYQEIAPVAQLFCDRCLPAYQKAKYQFDMMKPGAV